MQQAWGDGIWPAKQLVPNTWAKVDAGGCYHAPPQFVDLLKGFFVHIHIYIILYYIILYYSIHYIILYLYREMSQILDWPRSWIDQVERHILSHGRVPGGASCIISGKFSHGTYESPSETKQKHIKYAPLLMSYVIYVLPTQCQHSVTIFHIGPHITSEMRMCVCVSFPGK